MGNLSASDRETGQMQSCRRRRKSNSETSNQQCAMRDARRTNTKGEQRRGTSPRCCFWEGEHADVKALRGRGSGRRRPCSCSCGTLHNRRAQLHQSQNRQRKRTLRFRSSKSLRPPKKKVSRPPPAPVTAAPAAAPTLADVPRPPAAPAWAGALEVPMSPTTAAANCQSTRCPPASAS